MKESKVFFIGDVALDEYYEAPYFPKIKDKVIVKTLKSEMGGMIANAACVFSALGGNAGFMAALNPSYISKHLCDNLQELGIDTEFITWDDTLPDSKTIIILAEKEHTIFIPTMNLQEFKLSNEAFEALKFCEYIFSNIVELKPLVYKNIKAEGILKELKNNGVKLWCDLDVADIDESDLNLLSCVDTVFLNEKGKENIESKFKNAIDSFFFSFGIDKIILTEAEKGCTIYEKNQEHFKIAGIKVKGNDVTGAGDTFASSFLYSYMKTKNTRLSANFANLAAARSVTGKGARYGAVDVETVLAFVKSFNIDTKDFECLIAGPAQE